MKRSLLLLALFVSILDHPDNPKHAIIEACSRPDHCVWVRVEKRWLDDESKLSEIGDRLKLRLGIDDN